MKSKRFEFKRAAAAALAGVMAFSAMGMTAFAKETNTNALSALTQEAMAAAETNGLKLWYTKPGTDWASTGLVLGNGYMGTILFGDVANDRIHLNEKELWNGGRSKGSEDLLFGNRAEAASAETIAKIQADLEAQEYNNDGGNLSPMMAPGSAKGAYLDFGEINVDFSPSGHTFDGVTDYVRSLDLNTGISAVEYNYAGVDYTRSYFSSYPDKVQVYRYEASEDGKLSFDVKLSSAQGGAITSEGDTIQMAGALNGNGLRYASQVKVVAEGGTVTAEGGKILVRDADTVTLYQTSDTDYLNDYPVYRNGEDPNEAVTEVIANAAEKGYEAVLNTHVEDHYGLMSRVNVDIGQKPSTIPTDEMMANYRQNIYDPLAEVLTYQFGRYVTVAGSRPGTLPTNLNGVWCVGNAEWTGDYHFNINVQMNYWPTYVSNLAECGTSFVEYVDSLRVQGRISAGQSHGVPSAEGEENGWVVHTAAGIFGGTSPYNSQEWGWNMGGAAWALQAVYDYYRFTGDKEYLAEHIYPAMREQAKFWDAYLIRSPKQNNRLVVSPGVSPEQGPTSIGTTYDQALVWQLYKEAAEAAEILGVDEDLRAGWLEKMDELDPIQIGLDGQVKEWYDEGHIGQMGNGAKIFNWNAGGADVHRHLSHLVSLYPGSLINKDTTEWMEAAKVSLEHRGFEITTSWSKGHRFSCWARTMDGNKTYRMLQAFLTQGNRGIMDNLLSSHGAHGGHLSSASRIFQIDGNYGYAAGFAEMFVQSHLGYIQPLPAIPDAWGNGHVEGLLARGNFTCDMSWANKVMNKMVVTANIGGDCVIEYPGITEATVVDASGNAVSFETVAENRISFATTEGGVYTITNIPGSVSSDIAAPENVILYRTDVNKMEMAWDAVEGASEYVVYREQLKTVESGQSKDSRYGEGFELAGTTTETSFVDTDVVADDTYYYMIAAVVDGDEGGACQPVMSVNLGLAEAIAAAEEAAAQLTSEAVANLRDELNALITEAKAMDETTPFTERAAIRNELIAATEKAGPAVALSAKIAEAQALLDLQTTGEEAWRLPQDLYDGLKNAIAAGQAILDAGVENATADEINTAIDNMNKAMKAVNTFNDTVFAKIELNGVQITMTPTYADDRFEIRYTTDGSAATAESELYTVPVQMTNPNASLSIHAQIFLDGQPVGNPSALSKIGTNLAVGKPTEGEGNFYYPEWYPITAVTDGNRNSNCYIVSAPVSVVVDLGEVTKLSSAVVHERGWSNVTITDYEIFVSNDKAAWTSVCKVEGNTEMTRNCALAGGAEGRYVKLVITGASQFSALGEFEIYGVDDVQLVPVTGIALDKANAAVYVGDTVALTATVDPDVIEKPYIAWTSSDENVATVDQSGVVTAVSAGEAVITATAGDKSAACTVTVKPNTVDVTMVVSGDEKITVDAETVSFTVSAKDAVELATADVELTMDTETMGEPEVTPAAGWYVIVKTWENGKLHVILGNNDSVTAAEAELFTITAPTTGVRGNATVTLDKVTLCAYYGEGSEKFVPAILGEESSITTVVTYSTYDVNQDGKVDQLDITRAQRFYGTANETCDVNGDGEVNIADLILIANNYSK